MTAPPVPHETNFFSSAIRAQIGSLMRGERRSVRHGHTLCSHCLTNPPGKSGGYCNHCHALYQKLRRGGADLKGFYEAWARDAEEKRREAGYGREKQQGAGQE